MTRYIWIVLALVLLQGCGEEPKTEKKPNLFVGPGGKPPPYLSIPKVNECLGIKNMGTWQAWCIPIKRPNTCPEASWSSLNGLKDKPSQCNITDNAPK